MVSRFRRSQRTWVHQVRDIVSGLLAFPGSSLLSESIITLRKEAPPLPDSISALEAQRTRLLQEFLGLEISARLHYRVPASLWQTDLSLCPSDDPA